MDYEDHKVWKEVSGEPHFLNEYEYFTPDELAGLFTALIKEAEESGLEGCKLFFSSSYEPYEDSLGSASVCVTGYRKFTEEEKKANLKLEEELKLSKEMAISPYEAKLIMKLREQGKL